MTLYIYVMSHWATKLEIHTSHFCPNYRMELSFTVLEKKLKKCFPHKKVTFLVNSLKAKFGQIFAFSEIVEPCA